MESSLTDPLIARARGGDQKAQAQLFEAAAEPALSYIRLRLGARLRQEVDSMDILQEAFVAAHRDLPQADIDSFGDYLKWLCRIIEHRSLQGSEKANAAKRLSPGRREALSGIMDRVRDRVTGPQTAALRSERKDRIHAALKAEPDDIRQVLLARFFEGRTLDAIAKTTGKSPSGVRRILGEAAIRLARQLRDLGESA
ncbi:MAG: sigma-70 family RNA polymerase sigma factor [Planctomycetota bacterium]